MTQAENFEQFYNNFRVPSVEWALKMFRVTPFARRYTPLENGVQEIEVRWPDLSVYRAIEKIREGK